VCLGARGDFDRIRWFRVTADTFASFKCYAPGDARPEMCGGQWVPPHNIRLAEAYSAEPMVKHEAVHDFLSGGQETDPAFRCAVIAP